MEISVNPGPLTLRSADLAHRIGDVALFAIWATQAVASSVKAFRLFTRGDLLGGFHVSAVATVLFIMGALFLARGKAVQTSRGISAKLVAIVGTWSIFLVAAQPLTWRPDWLLTSVTAGLIAAYMFVIWAVLTLRRNLSIYPEARALVRHGPYAMIRHPLYSAHIACYALILVPRATPLALVFAVAGICAEVLRARNEEHILRSAFVEYRDYAEVTPRFMPSPDAVLKLIRRGVLERGSPAAGR